MTLEDFTGKDSLVEIHKLAHEKKTLEKRVQQLEQTSTNWANIQRNKLEETKRSTMTNFAKRSMIEQKFETGQIPVRRQPTRESTFDDDYEPVRPSMNQNVPQFHHGAHPQMKMMPGGEEEESYGEEALSMDQARNSGGYGQIQKARSIQAPNYRITQGNAHSRKSNSRSFYGIFVA